MSRNGTLLPIPEGSVVQLALAGLTDDWNDDNYAGMMWPRSSWLRDAEAILSAAYPVASSADRKLTARHLAPFPLALGPYNLWRRRFAIRARREGAADRRAELPAARSRLRASMSHINGPSDFDVAHMSDIIAGEGDWFSAHLLRLFAKADANNRLKLADAFPAHASAFLRWELGLTPFPLRATTPAARTNTTAAATDHDHTGKGCQVCADRADEQINSPSIALGEDFDAENGAGASDELLGIAAENAGLPPCPFCGGELCAVTLGEPVNAPGVSCGGCGAYTSRLPWREPWLYEGSKRG